MLGLKKESVNPLERGTLSGKSLGEKKQTAKAVFPERKSSGLTAEQRAFNGFSGVNKSLWQEEDRDEIKPIGWKSEDSVEPVKSTAKPIWTLPKEPVKSTSDAKSTEPMTDTEPSGVKALLKEQEKSVETTKADDTTQALVQTKEAVAEDEMKEERPMILGKLEKSVAAKVQLPVGLDSAKIQYADGVQAGVVHDAELYLPIRFVYVNGLAVPFDKVGEVHIQKDTRVEVDFGTSFVLPAGVAISMSMVPECEQKFGLMLISDSVISGKDSLFTLVAEFKALDDIAYVSKFRSVVKIRFVKEAA